MAYNNTLFYQLFRQWIKAHMDYNWTYFQQNRSLPVF